jgi:hypothetical protein
MSTPRVALALADTQSYVLANNALQACVSRFAFSQVYVFTDAPHYWPQYHTVAVERMRGIEDYNRIVLDLLPTCVEEDFCLVCQFDGFILNAEAFSPTFYQYDYIGAVWPDYPHHRVGNGGFSWRSKRLMDAVASLSHLRPVGQAEDLFIGRTIRSELEAQHGCVFADEATAQAFSFEIVPHAAPAFGFHGIFNLPRVYRDNLKFLVENLPPHVLAERLPYLRYGANQLEPAQRQEFEALAAQALSLARTAPTEA